VSTRAFGRRGWRSAAKRVAGAIALVSLLTLGVSAGYASASPLIQSESASGITATNATLQASIDPQAASAGVFYQFQLLFDPSESPSELACPSSPPSGYSVCVGPQDSGALPLASLCGECENELGTVPISLDLASAGVTLEPGRTYYFRVLAADRKFSEDAAEWEAPAVVGASKKFTTPPIGAQPLSMTFTEDRANVGVQLSDAAMFTAPDFAPFAAQIDPGTGSITAGSLKVPDFSTHITEPLDADVNVHFEIGIIEGSFDQATGALTLEGEANATLTSEGKECAVTTAPNPLVLSTAENSGGANPRSGAPFVNGLTGAGAIAGRWTDMNATPKVPGDGVFVCATVDERIEGPGGIWLAQEGDVVSPAVPRLTSTDPASPGSSGTPRVRGSAEAGSTVRLYSGSGCGGSPVATGSAAGLDSPGITVQVAEGATASFSATATDAAHNTSACSAPISYMHAKPESRCVVPDVVGNKPKAAKRKIRAAGCEVGKVTGPRARKGRKHRPPVVKSSNPSAGTVLAAGSQVNLKLGLRPRKSRPASQ
jgi:PASTA domain